MAFKDLEPGAIWKEVAAEYDGYDGINAANLPAGAEWVLLAKDFTEEADEVVGMNRHVPVQVYRNFPEED
jgi:hypothetical protein